MRRDITIRAIFWLMCTLVPSTVFAQSYLENPQPRSAASGIGVISGWICEASNVTIQVDNGDRMETAYGTIRPDTRDQCGDADNGFAILVNFNTFGSGTHTVRAFADGKQFAKSLFYVSTLGTDFLRGADSTVTVRDFPTPGEQVTLQWQQSAQNFIIIDYGSRNQGRDGVYDLARVSLQDPQQTVLDSLQSSVRVSGRMRISGNRTVQTIRISVGGRPAQGASVSARCEFDQAVVRCVTDSGAPSQLILVEKGSRLVTSVLAEIPGLGLINEIDYWRKVSPQLQSQTELSIERDNAILPDGPVGGLGATAYDR